MLRRNKKVQDADSSDSQPGTSNMDLGSSSFSTRRYACGAIKKKESSVTQVVGSGYYGIFRKLSGARCIIIAGDTCAQLIK